MFGNTTERSGCRIPAFYLMSNHTHFAVQVSDILQSRVMQNLPWLETGALLSRFSTMVGKTRTLIADFIEELITEGRRKEFNGEERSGGWNNDATRIRNKKTIGYLGHWTILKISRPDPIVFFLTKAQGSGLKE